MPFVSQQKGRMSALLKQKSKIVTKRKPRITYEPHQTLKRMRDPEKQSFSQIPLQTATQSQTQSSNQKRKVQPTILEKLDQTMKEEKKQ